jgi:syndecan 1
VAALAEVTEDERFAALPVVADARHWDLADRLADRGQPFLVRVPSSTQLPLPVSARVGRGGERLPARQIMAMAKDLRRPVGWLDDGVEPRERVTLVADVPVHLPGAGGSGTLLGVAGLGEDWPAELWLAGGGGARAADLFPLTRLPGRVDRDFTDITDRVGIRDFTGRSYDGWHRHVTLASTAHAVETLKRRFSRRRLPLLAAR